MDIPTRQKRPLIRYTDHNLYQANFSPDDRWVSFVSQTGSDTTQVFVTPFHEGTSTEPAGWIPITDGKRWDDKPRWSPDGKLLYFVSRRDGFPCLWAQRLDPRQKRPIGSPFPVYHFHETRRSPANTMLLAVELSIAQDRIVLNLVEKTGNIWIAQLEKQN